MLFSLESSSTFFSLYLLMGKKDVSDLAFSAKVFFSSSEFQLVFQ